MQVTIKALSGGNFQVNVEPEDTVAAVKQKIKDLKGHPVENQKIIFSGKVLEDGKTIQECNIKEKDFLVSMVSKPKAPKPESSSSSAPAPPAAAPAASATPSGSAAAPAAPAAAPAASSEGAAAPAASDATAAPSTTSAAADSGPVGSSASFLRGPELESAIQNMTEMGFERPQVERALRASFNNPDRAVEYLMTGIPENLEQAAAPAAGAGVGAGAAAPAGAEAGSGGASAAAPQQRSAQTQAAAAGAATQARGGNLFEAAAQVAQGRGGAGAGGSGALGGEDDGEGNELVDLGNPQMLQQLQTLAQQNPAALQPLVQAIAQQNPQLAAALQQNPAAVLTMLQGLGEQGMGGEEVEVPDFDSLSQEDRDNIGMITGMGVPQDKAVEVYFACGKNAELAVSYYFEHPDDFAD